MDLVYSAIAKDKLVLCEYTKCTGNFHQICYNLLKRIKPNSKGVVEYGYKRFLYIRDDLLTVITLLIDEDDKIGNDYIYNYLLKLLKRFYKKHSKSDLADARSYSFDSFADVLKFTMSKLVINVSRAKPSKAEIDELMSFHNDQESRIFNI